jgi:hypothetical protein
MKKKPKIVKSKYIPKYEGGGYSTPEGTFDMHGNKVAGPYGESMNSGISGSQALGYAGVAANMAGNMNKQPQGMQYGSNQYFDERTRNMNAGQSVANGVGTAIPIAGAFKAVGEGLSNTIAPKDAYGVSHNGDLAVGAAGFLNPLESTTSAFNDIKKGKFNKKTAANLILPGVGAVMQNKENLAQENTLKNNYNQQQPVMYKHGGMKHNPHLTFSGFPIIPLHEEGGIQPNAQLEKSEIFKTPDGSIDGVNGPSHEMGGVNINIPGGTKILSDKLKLDGKTFAKLGAKYKTIKEDKILDDSMATPASKLSAKLSAEIKQKKLDQLFQAQESLKQSKLKSYADKLGIQLPQVSPQDNEQIEPQGQSEQSEGEYKYGGIHIKKSQQGSLHRHLGIPEGEKIPTSKLQIHEGDSPAIRKKKQFAINASHWKHEMGGIHKYDDGGEHPYKGLTNQQAYNRDYMIADNAGNPMVTLPPIQGKLDESINYNAPEVEQDNMGQPSIHELNWGTPKTLKDPNNSNIPYGDIASVAANSAGALYDIYNTKGGKKYDKVNYGTIKPKLIDYSQSLRDADRINSNTTNALKQNVGGNAGAYLSNLGQLQADNTMNKANIRQQGEAQNTGILNNAIYANQAIGQQQTEANLASKQRVEDINRKAIRDIGQNYAVAYNDFKRGRMDTQTAALLSGMFKNYGLNMNNIGDWSKAQQIIFKQA